MRRLVVMSLVGLLTAASAGGARGNEVKRLLARCPALADAAGPGSPDAPIARVERIGKRDAYQVFGKKTRYYVFPAKDACHVFPVVGKPEAFARVRYAPATAGGVAYALAEPERGDEDNLYAISLKTADDRFVDAMLLDMPCYYGVALKRLSYFDDHESLLVSCLTGGGADAGEVVDVVDVRDGAMRVLHQADLGISWVQNPEDPDTSHGHLCTARHVGSLKLATVGDHRVLRIVTPVTDAQRKAIPPDRWTSGGCAGYGARADWTYDERAHRFVRATRYKIIFDEHLCDHCKKR